MMTHATRAWGGWVRGVFGHAQKHGLGPANVIKVMFGDNYRLSSPPALGPQGPGGERGAGGRELR